VIIITNEDIYWIDADGGALYLTDGVKYSVLAGVDGRWMPPFEMITDETYAKPGDSVRLRKTKARDVTLPLAVYGATTSDFRANMRMLTDAFDPSKGDGFLKVITPDDRTLLLKCHYLDGMTMPESYDTGNCKFRIFVATFQAHNPYWFNALENEKIWTAGYTASHAITVFNAGDVDTYPLWVITGGYPYTGFTLENYTTGKMITMSGISLTDNSYAIYIDTRIGKSYVYHNFTTNYFKYLSGTSELFSLAPGMNQIRVNYIGAAPDPDCYVKCRWVDQYYGI
jgi:phage-related protein